MPCASREAAAEAATAKSARPFGLGWEAVAAADRTLDDVPHRLRVRSLPGRLPNPTQPMVLYAHTPYLPNHFFLGPSQAGGD